VQASLNLTLVDTLQRRADDETARVAYRFLTEGAADGPVQEWTWGQVAGRARAIAAELTTRGLSSQPVLLLYPSGLEFIAAFFGCLYAGAIAVPAYPPDPSRLARTLPRLQGIARDARARAVLTTAGIRRLSPLLSNAAPDLSGLTWIVSDALVEGDWRRPPDLRRESVAFLQYTSGSTSRPKGVVVTHANLLHNQEVIREAFGHDRDLVAMGWLPLFHDMGLIGYVLQPLHVGGVSNLMAPEDFLRRPIEWLRGISRFRATSSGGPDFAYALCARKATEKNIAGLDLSCWRVAYTGAEPVRADTLRRFAERMAPTGFRATSLLPCYGLAESTLMTTCAPRGVIRDDGTVSVGRPLCGTEVRIVDPDTRETVQDGQVGEIWVRGESVAAGYWGQEEATAATFAARTASGEGPFLRTGDLGAIHDGELRVTGRAKDVIIIRGRQLYPEDLEPAIEESHPAIRAGRSVAFGVDVDGEERVAVACEVGVGAGADEVADAVRGAVALAADAPVHAVALLRKHALPRTSSGKRQRGATRQAFLEGTLEETARVVFPETAAPEDPPPATLAAMEEWLARQVAALLGRHADRVPRDATFQALGLDSLKVVELAARLDEKLERPMHPSILFNVPTITRLAAWLVEDGRTASTVEPGASLYGDVESALERLDRRNPETYRFDLERDVPWHRVGEPGVYVPPEALERLGLDVGPLAADPEAWCLFQAASALTMCAAFELVEVTITLFIDTRRPALGETRSIEAFREEESKHVRLFRRYARELAALHPSLAVGLHWDQSWGVGFWELFRNPQLFPHERVFHYLFWFFFVAFEEHSIYFADQLARAEGVQPAWREAHRMHRREEIQHVATDLAYLKALDLGDRERDTWSEVCVAWLCQHFETFFAFGPARRLTAERFPHLAPALRTKGFVRSPFLQDLLGAPSFQRTRLACPYLGELRALGPKRWPSDADLAGRLPAAWMEGRAPTPPNPVTLA
jgi:acyl-CoA synthetase (AMP-forming)/AMP-acid ligase II/acyl carrier protein